MRPAAILAVALLIPLPPSPAAGRDAARSFGRSSSTQAPAPAENAQNPATDQAQPNAADQSESKPDQTPPAKEAEKPNLQKPPSSRPATGVRKRRARAHKATTPPTTDGEPRKIVVHQGGSSEPIAQIVPGITLEEASHQRENAEQLLASTESNLKQLAARTLNPHQQEMIVQIRHYMDGARFSLKESDTQRAHTLALKAYLLSDDLMKH